MNQTAMIPICDKNAAADFVAELSMPDYQPEVRRLLRVGVTLTPPEPFFDGSRVGMSGEAVYDILYAAGDGELYSTKTAESYELSEAFRGSWGDGEPVLLCDVTPESLTSRVTAPRKLSIKCRLRGRMRGFAEVPIAEEMTYVDDLSSIKRLMGDAEYVRILPSAVTKTEITDELPTENSSLRVVSHTASVEVESVELGQDEAAVNGAVCLSILVCDEENEGRLSRLERKIPFSESVDAEGLSPACEAVAAGVCHSAEFEVGESAITCTLGICLKVSASELCRAEFARDIYSTAVHSETVMKSYEITAPERVFSGNLTASLYEPLESLGLEGCGEIIDVAASAAVKNIEFDKRSWAVIGEVAMELLAKRDGEFVTKELKLPFRYETEGRGGAVSLAEATAIPVSVKARSDGARLGADCELKLVGRICTKEVLEAVGQCVFGEPVERDGALTVCFVSPTDSVWDVAKRYHVSTDEIIAKNGKSDVTGAGYLIV